jgi:nucleoside-diphosphate-sugar epimerase
MRIACFRPHWVIPEELAYNPEELHRAQGNWKDLWGWTSVGGTARAFLSGITAPTSSFPLGAETFFIVAPTIVQQTSSLELLKKYYPDLKCDMRGEWKGNEGFFDCSKAKRMLGWEERAFPWTPK